MTPRFNPAFLWALAAGVGLWVLLGCALYAYL